MHQLLSPYAASTEAHVPRACAPQEKPLQWEGQKPQLESSPCLPQLEKACEQRECPAQPKINKWKSFKSSYS